MGATIYERLLMSKIEVTKGTDAVPVVGTDAVRVSSVEIAIAQENKERVVVKKTMGPLPHVIGKATMEMTIEVELRGSGAAGTAPDFGTLLRACGLDNTNVPATSEAYDPLTLTSVVPHESVTIYWYEDGLLWKMLGAVGDFVLTYEIDEIPKIAFTMSAPYTVPTTVACPSGAVFQTTAPIAASSADVISEGGAINVGSFELACGNDVQEHYKTGLHEFVVAGRTPTFKLTKQSASTIADWTALRAATQVALSAIIDGGAGNKWTITGDVASRMAITGAINAERHDREVEYGLYETTGDDQFKLLSE